MYILQKFFTLFTTNLKCFLINARRDATKGLVMGCSILIKSIDIDYCTLEMSVHFSSSYIMSCEVHHARF